MRKRQEQRQNPSEPQESGSAEQRGVQEDKPTINELGQALPMSYIQKVEVDKLNDITYRKVRKFLYDYNLAKRQHAHIRLRSYLNFNVNETLIARGVDVEDEEELQQYFKKYIAERRKEDSTYVLDELAR